MKEICVVRSDNYTYSFEETLFVTNDELSNDVYNRLNREFVISEDAFLALACLGEVVVKNRNGGEEILTMRDVEVV